MKYCKQSFQPSSCILEAIKELNDTLLTAFKTPSKKVGFILIDVSNSSSMMVNPQLYTVSTKSSC